MSDRHRGLQRSDQLDADAYFSIVPEFVVYSANPRAIQIYAILARYTDNQNKAFPSRSTLARLAGCSEDTVDRAIKFLVKFGLGEGGPTDGVPVSAVG